LSPPSSSPAAAASSLSLAALSPVTKSVNVYKKEFRLFSNISNKLNFIGELISKRYETCNLL
jgi:hypothetical protein